MIPSYDTTQPNQLIGKVLLAGPSGSGKSSTLAAFSRSHSLTPAGAILRMDMRERMVRKEGDQLSIQPIDIHVPENAFSYEMLPFDFGEVNSRRVRATCYALPGHPSAHDAIDRVWRGTDVLIFVADGRAESIDENRRSWARIKTNGWVVEAQPRLLLQINRNDAPTTVAPEKLIAALDWPTRHFFASVASTGEGVEAIALETRRLIHQTAAALTGS